MAQITISIDALKNEIMLRPEELADLLRMKPDSLTLWRHRNRGPNFVKLGSRVLYPESAVNDWLAANV